MCFREREVFLQFGVDKFRPPQRVPVDRSGVKVSPGENSSSAARKRIIFFVPIDVLLEGIWQGTEEQAPPTSRRMDLSELEFIGREFREEMALPS